MSKTLVQLLTEMQSFVPGITSEEIEKAEKLILPVSQANAVNELRRDWINCKYDECPEELVKELRYFIQYGSKNNSSK